MPELVPFCVSALCAVLALVNVPLLVVRSGAAEQRLWRRLRVRRVRRWLTRVRGTGELQLDSRTAAVAKRNIRWHPVLTFVIALLMLHPALTALPYRAAVYAFAVAGCIAYVVGSVVQRQKIVVTSNSQVHRAARTSRLKT